MKRPLIHNPSISHDIYDEAVRIGQQPGVKVVVRAAADNACSLADLIKKHEPRQRSRDIERLMRQFFDSNDFVALVYTDGRHAGIVVAKGARMLWEFTQMPGTHLYSIAYMMMPNFDLAENFAHELGDLGDPVVGVRRSRSSAA